MKAICLICLCVLFLGIGSTIFAQQASSTAEDEKTSEEERKYPEKRKSRETWETIVSFPGRLIVFPFKLVFKGVGGIATFFEETHVLTRINDFLNSDDGVRSALPEYSAQTGLGMAYTHRNLLFKESELTVRASLGLRMRRGFEVSLRDISLGGNAYASLLTGYRFLTDEPFFSLGNDPISQSKSNYAHEQIIYEFSLGMKVSKNIAIYTQIGYETNRIREGRNKSLPSTTDSVLDTEKILPGLTEHVNLGKLEFTLHYDGKNHQGRPTAGSEVIINGSVFNDFRNGEFGFWKASVDIMQYINLFLNRVLVLRFMGEVTDPLLDKEIPFFYLSQIGNLETVRGFHRGQFRDKDMILGSLEYRYPIWHFFDAVLFVDAGKVSDHIFDDFSTRGLHVGYGGGIRIWGDKGMAAKFEIANSRDGIRLYFVLGKGTVR